MKIFYNSYIMELSKLTKANINNYQFIIKNDELKQFFYNITNNITYFIDKEDKSIEINFIYKDNTFNLYKDNDINRLSITKKYSYEIFWDSYENILINKCELKTVSIDEINKFIKQLFLCIYNI